MAKYFRWERNNHALRWQPAFFHGAKPPEKLIKEDVANFTNFIEVEDTVDFATATRLYPSPPQFSLKDA